MKTSRTNKSARRPSTSKANTANKKNGSGTGLSPSKRHREKLNSVMDELCELLPLSNEVKANLDRLSVLKLTVSFFHTQNLMITDTSSTSIRQRNGDEKQVVAIDGGSLSELALQAIGGFFLVLTEDGIVYYISENVKNYLGYPQTRLIHQEFFPIVDPDDLYGLNACFQTPNKNSFEGSYSNGRSAGGRQECFCNLKCHAGRLSSHISPFYYKCFKFYGHIKTVTNRCTGERKLGFFALCTPVTRQIDVCRPLNTNVEKYTCKMNAAMSNLEVDSRGLKILALSEKDLTGHSSYFFFHPEDLPGMALAHECLLLGRKVCISFRVLKGNKKWQWVRGRAYSIIANGKVEGMVSKNIFLSEEEGKYFKEQDMKDIMEWKTQNALISPSSQGCDSPNSGAMSPCSEKVSFHPVQVAPFPTCEVPSEGNTGTTPSSLTNGLPQECSLILPNKKERSSCLVSDNPPPFKDIPDIDTDTMLRVIKDLQNSLIDSSSTKTPPQYPPDIDMITGAAMDDMEQHLLENGFPLLDMSPNSSLHLTKHFCSEPASIHEIPQGFQHQVPESFFRFTENRLNGFPVVGPQSSVDMQQSRTPIARSIATENVRQPSDNKRLNMDGNSLADFVPLPLVEVENILSNDEHACSVTSSSASLTFAESMDMSPRCQYTNYFHGNQLDQFYGGNFVDGSAVQVSRSENELVAASLDCITDFPGHVALDDRVHPAR